MYGCVSLNSVALYVPLLAHLWERLDFFSCSFLTIWAGTKLLVVDADSNDIVSLSPPPYPLLLTTLPSAPIPDIVEEEEDDDDDDEDAEDEAEDDEEDATVLPRQLLTVLQVSLSAVLLS